MMQYEIITYDEFTKRKDGGFYVLYWTESGRYYGGRAVDYNRRKHEDTHTTGTYITNHWRKHGPPDIVVVIPLNKHHKEFEQTWLDIFRNGPLYDKSVCLNMSGRADWSFDCLTFEQRSKGGKKGAATNKKNGTGYHGLSLEQRRAAGKKGYPLSLGKLTPEQRSKHGRNTYSISLGTLTTKEMSDNAKRTHRKLSPQQVRFARRLWSDGADQLAIGSLFGLDSSTISRMVRGVTYADV